MAWRRRRAIVGDSNFTRRLPRATEPYAKLCEVFDEQTDDGKDMARFSGLLEAAISAIASQSDQKNLGNLFTGRGGEQIDDTKLPKSTTDFNLVTWLLIMPETERADG